MTAVQTEAQVTPIGEFTGDATETFEAIAPPGTTPGPAEIFGGEGVVFDTLTNNIIIAFNLISFQTGEEIFAYDGNFMAGSPTGFMTFQFDTPVTDFGGFIGTVDNLSGGHVEFRDASGATIADLPLDIPLNEWDWYGWHSDVPISSVAFFGSDVPAAPIVFDQMQAVFVPSPGAIGLLAASGLCTTRRRRRALPRR